MLEIVSQSVNQAINLDAMYDALVSLLLRSHRRRQAPSEGPMV